MTTAPASSRDIRDRLRALIEQWRQKAEEGRQLKLAHDLNQYVRGIEAGVSEARSWCADELEAISQLVKFGTATVDGDALAAPGAPSHRSGTFQPDTAALLLVSERPPDDPLQGIRDAKYLNPVCAVDGCQWLRKVGPPDDRLRALATERAEQLHNQFSTTGRHGSIDGNCAPFESCPHPDCRLVHAHGTTT
jgi:hypothetical protein